MAELITQGQLRDDDWQRLPAERADALPSGRLIVPLSRWLAQREPLRARPHTGVWLAGDEDPAVLAEDVERLPLIAVQFVRAGDGRGYSIGVQLRRRYGFRGELRAVGEVLRDQFEALTRCGFDALQPPAGRYTPAQLAQWLPLTPWFSAPYQASVIPDQPLYRRVARAA